MCRRRPVIVGRVFVLVQRGGEGRPVRVKQLSRFRRFCLSKDVPSIPRVDLLLKPDEVVYCSRGSGRRSGLDEWPRTFFRSYWVSSVPGGDVYRLYWSLVSVVYIAVYKHNVYWKAAHTHKFLLCPKAQVSCTTIILILIFSWSLYRRSWCSMCNGAAYELSLCGRVVAILKGPGSSRMKLIHEIYEGFPYLMSDNCLIRSLLPMYNKINYKPITYTSE